MKILDKSIVSPLADGWKLYYDYYLTDSMQIGPHWCYKIEVYPKRPSELAYEGAIWIDSKSYALKQIDVFIGQQANINFVERVKIQQEYSLTEKGPWVPVKTRVLIDVAELTKKSPSLLVKFYISNEGFELDKSYDLRFFKENIEIDQNAYEFDSEYWQKNRHDSLSPAEIKTYALIDTIKEVPMSKPTPKLWKYSALATKTSAPSILVTISTPTLLMTLRGTASASACAPTAHSAAKLS
ncbi:MAG: hypothetical protein HC880_02240 [Bacteroidia bacterium]|nr:hypothetical protein [Bacteroidia bacterium]